MDANEAIRWIHSRRYTGHKNGLENTRALLAALGNPERGFLSLHIAGTNGKGSTAAMCDSCLRHSGYATGLYTSPYLENYRERIRVNGMCIPETASPPRPLKSAQRWPSGISAKRACRWR